MKTSFCFLLLISFLIPHSLRAQLPDLNQNTTYRITSSKTFPNYLIGKVQKQTRDSLFVLIGARIYDLSAQEVKKIEIKAKSKRHTVLGFVLGAVPTSLILGSYFQSQEESAEGYQKVGQPGGASGFLLGALGGGIVGGLIGHSLVSESWQEIYPRNKVRRPLKGEKSPEIAGAMSLFLPGLGQYYNGDPDKGLFQQILFVSGIFLAARGFEENSPKQAVGIGLVVGTTVWSVIDAVKSAKKKNAQIQQRLKSKNWEQ